MYEQVILAMLPEIVIAGMACIILLLDAFMKKSWVLFNYWLVVFTIFTAIYLAYGTNDFAGMGIVVTKCSMLLKMILCALASIAFIYAKKYMQDRGLLKGEYFILYLVAILALLLLISSNNFIVLYLAVELFSLPVYALIAFNNKKYVALEASFKYFIIGALGSAILLYGVSLLYGVTGEVGFAVCAVSVDKILVFKFSLIFIMIGLLVKLGLIPFHMWLPDVYEGAPTSVGVFIATVPKIAFFVVLYRILTVTYSELFSDWQYIMMALATLSIGFGNIVAIRQDNIKRMLAYSTIANIGFATLGLIMKEQIGFSVAIFYVVAYGIMYLGVFGIMLLLSNKEVEFNNIEDYCGLWDRHPWLAIVMLVFMFSLVGLPPFLGFYAKFFILKTIMSEGFIWLAVFVLLFSVIGVFYCLRVIKVMFFDKPIRQYDISYSGVILLSLHGLMVLLFGIFSGLILPLFSPSI